MVLFRCRGGVEDWQVEDWEVEDREQQDNADADKKEEDCEVEDGEQQDSEEEACGEYCGRLEAFCCSCNLSTSDLGLLFPTS
jgi:hypothetical protein